MKEQTVVYPGCCGKMKVNSFLILCKEGPTIIPRSEEDSSCMLEFLWNGRRTSLLKPPWKGHDCKIRDDLVLT